MTRMMRVWCLTGGSTGFGRALATLVFVAGVVAGAPMLAQAQAPRSPTSAPVPGAARVGSMPW